ncbi:MAG TPA: SH3 domain-containing protein [Thermoanaerobaculia bacterium]|nr:SH3 domain-containing protein [Thermoanaerobaculia bacterium]
MALSLLFWLAACGPEPGPVPGEEEPETIAIRYVAVPELQVREQPRADAAQVTIYRNGEPVSVVSVRGEWTEVFLGSGGTGWARTAELSETRESVTSRSQPRFRTPPSPVFSPTRVSGQIVLVASVNTAGEVVSVRTVSNTTGSALLEQKNVEELKKALFYPLMEGGSAKPFVYEHRVSY